MDKVNNLLPEKMDSYNILPLKEEGKLNPERFYSRSTYPNIAEMDGEGRITNYCMNSTSNIYRSEETNACDNLATHKIHHRGQIDVIDMPAEHCKYKYFFVYEDQLSKFVVLKALRCNTPKEVAVKLIDILAIIGPPQVLQSSNGRRFAEQVVHELRSLWDDFAILHADISEEQRDNRDFKSLLGCWVQRNPTRTWYEGLKFVQVLQNTTFRCRNDQFPCDILFGRKVREDFRRLIACTKLPKDEYTGEDRTGQAVNDDKMGAQKGFDTKDEQGDSAQVDAGNIYSQSHDYDSDSQSESREEPLTDSHGFNFVNVKSEHMSFEDEIMTDGSAKLNDNSTDLKCKICKKQYMKPGHLKNHMKTHAKSKKFECTLCSKTFHVLSLYEKHMRQSHGQSKPSPLSRTRRKKNSALNTSNENASVAGASPEKHDPINDIAPENSRTDIADDCSTEAKSASSPGKRKLSAENRATKVNGDSALECTYCKQKFSFPSVLKRHMRSHTNERPYICEVCNKSFKQLGHLSQHSLTHKDYRSFQCAVCGVKFESLDSLKVHSQSHKGEAVARGKEVFRFFECDNCKKVFTTKSVLERHIFTHTHERQFGCKVCGKRFKQAGHVKSHMLVHTGERKFECTVCAKRFSLSNSLKKHMYVHNGEKPYQCDVCGARFLEKRNLNGHLMTHTNERPFRCKVCGKRYTLADTLRRHISAAHEDGRTYQCEICAKMFKQLAHLSVHKKVHNDERPFQCHLCEKTFKHKNVLKSHLAIHANVRPFECDVCKATFVRKTNLQTHIASAHMNERPYACTICGKRFKQISHLNGHVVVHSNSMPYQCDFCDRRCNRLDNLKKHMRLHTKNKE